MSNFWGAVQTLKCGFQTTFSFSAALLRLLGFLFFRFFDFAVVFVIRMEEPVETDGVFQLAAV